MMFGTNSTETFAKRHGASEWCIVAGRDYQVKNPPSEALD